MKKNPTKCTVKLRKHETRNEWYLYIEAYPVYVNGNAQPKRVREYLNRTITTPIFNKSAVARTNGKVKTYQPRRDVNGVIMCRTEADNIACVLPTAARTNSNTNMIMLNFTPPAKRNTLNRWKCRSKISLPISER